MAIRYYFTLALLVVLTYACNGQISKANKEWLIKKTLSDLVFVEGGTYMMGDVGYKDSLGQHQLFDYDPNSRPVHQVTLDSYSMGRYEVTFKEFDLFCQHNGKELVGQRFRGRQIIQPQLTAIWLDWYQAKDYCDWLSEITGLPFSLASEAQWEYAARSRGKAVKYATDNGEIDYGRNFKRKDYGVASNPPPGTFPPNSLGLYDMTGCEAEWVLESWYSYTPDPQVNPIPRTGGSYMVVRGFEGIGSGGVYALYGRGYREPTNTGAGIGIRFVVNQKEPIDVEAVLKRLGISPITDEERAMFPPKTWPVEPKE